MTFQEMLKERLSPTDWQRLQAFTASMAPEQRGSNDAVHCPTRDSCSDSG
jgi:hypothetical protein